MKQVALSEVAEIIMGQSPPSATYNTVGEGLPFFQGKAEFGDLHPSARVYCTEPKKIAEAGDILISVRAPVGPTNINPYRSCIGRGLAAIRAKKETDTKYLLYFLRWHEPKLVQLGTGSTFEAVSHDDLEEIQIPVQPISKQRQIANFLNRADRLRRQRRYALELSDTYLQAVFLEMFGDPSVSSNGWGVDELGNLIEGFDAGVNFPPVAEGGPASDWRVLKVSAVTWGDFNPDESKPISPDVKFDNSIVVKKGDLLISRANTTELVGAVSLVRNVPPQVLLPDKLWRIRFASNSRLLPAYLLFVLRHPRLRRIIGDLATGSSGSMKNISQDKAATLPILVAPLKKQQEFALIFQQFERLRAQQHEALRQAEMLFQTLLHQAFAGEL